MVVLRGAGDRAFCAGGDIRALHDNRGTHVNAHFMAAEYALDYRIHTYPKPTVAFIDGIVMGGGMGFAQGTKLRVVGERTKMAMPEAAIGLFPRRGRQLVPLAHARQGRAVPRPSRDRRSVQPTRFTAGSRTATWAAPSLAPGEVERMRLAIDPALRAGRALPRSSSRCGPSVARVRRVGPAQRRASLERSSPTMLEVTFEQIRRGERLSLADCFRMELNLILAAFDHGDFVEASAR
jgi:enoyl-CoA hydratase/carnithine racemase